MMGVATHGAECVRCHRSFTSVDGATLCGTCPPRRVSRFWRWLWAISPRCPCPRCRRVRERPQNPPTGELARGGVIPRHSFGWLPGDRSVHPLAGTLPEPIVVPERRPSPTEWPPPERPRPPSPFEWPPTEEAKQGKIGVLGARPGASEGDQGD